jgi:hypothetical protein
MSAPVTPTDPFGTVAMMSSYLRVEISPVDVIARLALAAATSMIQDYTDQLIAHVANDTVTLFDSGSLGSDNAVHTVVVTWLGTVNVASTDAYVTVGSFNPTYLASPDWSLLAN